jgi:hypothetical protein
MAALCLLVAVVVAIVWERRSKPLAVVSRPAIDAGDSEALRLIANAYGVKPTQLRPTDRFLDELKMPRGWDGFDSPLAELSETLSIDAARCGVDLSTIHTVDDVVRLIETSREIERNVVHQDE